LDQIRRLLGNVSSQLGKLNASHRLLIASLAVVMLMALFLVSQYGGSPADAVNRATSYLDSAALPYKIVDGKLMVPAERQLAIFGALGEAGKLPEDSSLTFRTYAEKQNWMNPKSENDRLFNTALENTLALVIKNFKGIDKATVVIDAPEPRGMGANFRKPTASVVVFTRGGSALSSVMVDAIAATVSSAKSGLEPRNVNVTDGTTGRRFTPREENDFAASTYMEHLAKFEEYVREKISGHLSYIRGVNVAVNAQVDVRRTTSRNRTVKPKGAGSETLISKELATNMSQTQPTEGGEAGIGANVRMDVRGAGAANASSTTETGDTEYSTQFGMTEDQTVDPRGMPTKINATIGVPRDYVVKLWEQAQSTPPTSPPTDTDLKAIFELEKQRLEKDIAPLIETDAAPGNAAGEAVKAGSVVVSMVPVPTGGSGGGGSGDSADSAGSVGGVGSLALTGIVKQVSLGALAVLAMGMMLMMVRKAAKPADLPTAEEIVGVPPALLSSNDLVGEAEEGDTAMVGIEMDDEELKTKKMLEEVDELVRTKPGEAATLFTRWVLPEE